MKKKRRVNKKRVFILILLIALIVVGAVLAFQKLNTKDTAKKVKEVDKIEAYGYTLKENATSYYKSLFKQLDKVLTSKEVNENKYSKLVAQMFIADFFNLDNKISKNDVGGKQFVYSSYQTDFEKYAMESVYKSVESDVYGNRKQDLPIVTKVTVTKVSQDKFTYGDNTDEEAYTYNFEIEYKEDLGYQTSGSLTLIHNDKKIEVAQMSEKSSEE